MFPEAHETFILRELLTLERKGVDFEIFSLQFPRKRVAYPGIERMIARTHYAPLWGFRQLRALMRAAFPAPLRMLALLGVIGRTFFSDPLEALKSVAVIPLALYYGELARERGIGRLHGHWRNVPTTACWIISAFYDLPWSAAIHGENVYVRNALLVRKLQDARFVTVCNRYGFDYLRTSVCPHDPEKIFLNYHGVDENVFAAARDKRTRSSGCREIVSVGRLVDSKGFDDLLAAFEILAADGIDARLRIVGEGPDEARLKKIAADLGLNEKVVFDGYLEFGKTAGLVACADVFVLACVARPGRSFDGIPNVLAEAMALKTPVVSTAVSGIPELVEDGVSGLLVGEKSPVTLAAAIGRVLTDEELAQKLTENAAKKVLEMFNLDKNVDELIGIMQKFDGYDPDKPFLACNGGGNSGY